MPLCDSLRTEYAEEAVTEDDNIKLFNTYLIENSTEHQDSSSKI